MRPQPGSALLEFALAWPVALLLVIGCVQLAIWGSEAHAARQSALAGARAGSRADDSEAASRQVALAALNPALVGVAAAPWCPGEARRQPAVWVCVRSSQSAVEVAVGGAVPALVPLLPGAYGLPVSARARLAREVFR